MEMDSCFLYAIQINRFANPVGVDVCSLLTIILYCTRSPLHRSQIMSEVVLRLAWKAAVLMALVGAQGTTNHGGPVPLSGSVRGSPGLVAGAATRIIVQLTMCEDNMCHLDCQTYVTPLNSCFSSGNLFPNDPSWSDGWDIWDTTRGEVVGLSGGVGEEEEAAEHATPKTLHRVIFSSKNGTCVGHNPDSFDIPLNFCVGPFGAPRPWGTFELFLLPVPEGGGKGNVSANTASVA